MGLGVGGGGSLKDGVKRMGVRARRDWKGSVCGEVGVGGGFDALKTVLDLEKIGFQASFKTGYGESQKRYNFRPCLKLDVVSHRNDKISGLV